MVVNISNQQTELHFQMSDIPSTSLHGKQSSEVKKKKWRDFVKTMVHEIVTHPQPDFALSLAFELGPGVGDLFEEYLVEQSSAHKTSKEKVQFDLILQSLQIITLTGISFVEAVEVC